MYIFVKFAHKRNKIREKTLLESFRISEDLVNLGKNIERCHLFQMTSI